MAKLYGWLDGPAPPHPTSHPPTPTQVQRSIERFKLGTWNDHICWIYKNDSGFYFKASLRDQYSLRQRQFKEKHSLETNFINELDFFFKGN